jgi:hypothetical protein
VNLWRRLILPVSTVSAFVYLALAAYPTLNRRERG